MPDMSIGGVATPAEIYRTNVAAQNAASGIQQAEEERASFGDIFNNLVRTANEQYEIADQGTQAILSGEADNLAQVMIDATKAETSLNMVIQIRNKVLDAYNEVMRMSL